MTERNKAKGKKERKKEQTQLLKSFASRKFQVRAYVPLPLRLCGTDESRVRGEMRSGPKNPPRGRTLP